MNADDLPSPLAALEARALALRTSAVDLTTRFPSLATFREAAEWDGDALAVIRVFDKYRATVAEVLEMEQKALEQATLEREKGPFLRYLLQPRTAEKAHQDHILQLQQALITIEEAKERLFDRLDRAPSSRAEQRAMILELNRILHEMVQQPMAVPEAMRRVPTGALATGEPASEPGRWDRMRAHYEMEVGRRPRKGKAASLSPRVEIEQRLERVSRFAGEDPPPATAILRCAYCGARRSHGSPCPRCGMDLPTLDL
jgi:lipopolysaccharide biosynthesis regulator YciM